MNYLLDVCLIALMFATSITPSMGSGQRLKLLRGTDASAIANQALQKGISVRLPVTSHAAPVPNADNEGALIVSIADSGGVYFGIDPVTPPALAEKIKRSLSGPEQKLYIKSDGRTPYARVMEVLDAARSAGVEAPILLTSQPESAAAGILGSPKGLDVLLVPPTSSGSESTIVQVLNSGSQSSTLQINNHHISWANLQSSLTQLFQDRSENVVLVKANGLVPLADVVHVIDTCHSTGAAVVLVTPGTVAR